MLRIKEWSEDDRPREKMFRQGCSSLSNAELLAILINSGNAEESAVELSQRMLHSFNNNLNTLGKQSVKDLSSRFKGIGMAKAAVIAAALELGRRRKDAMPESRLKILSSQNAYALFAPYMEDLSHEELWIALTNQAGYVIDKAQISRGGISETVADIRIILKLALQQLASGIVLCHNHPSGNLVPSRQDNLLTERLKKAAEYMDLRLLDHIIISNKSYYSYADEGVL